jgi:hypothetical protein
MKLISKLKYLSISVDKTRTYLRLVSILLAHLKYNTY